MSNSVLFIKTSSLGDVVHMLPAVSDARRAGVQIMDWVVERPFAEIPRLHPAIRAVLPVELRRWRKTFWRAETRTDIVAFARELRSCDYDAVIDTQGLIKSALIARLAHGVRYGRDWHSSREVPNFFYDQALRVPWTLHAVERNRLLVAQALGYPMPALLDYGIQAKPALFDWLPHSASNQTPYLVLLHATSADNKLWDEANWIALGRDYAARGIISVLPAGNDKERARSARLAQQIPNAIVAPALDIQSLAGIFAGAHAVIGVDTGLTHLAGALSAPTIGIYTATDPAATGLYGCARAVNLGGIGVSPSVIEVIAAIEKVIA